MPAQRPVDPLIRLQVLNEKLRRENHRWKVLASVCGFLFLAGVFFAGCP